MARESNRPYLTLKTFWQPDLLSSGIAMFLFAAAVKSGLSSELETVTYSGLISIIRDKSQYIGVTGLLILLYTWASQPRFPALQISYPAIWLFIFKLMLGIRLITTPEHGIDQAISLVSIFALYLILISKLASSNSERYYNSLFKGLYYFTAIILALNLYLYLFEYSTTSWKGRFVGVFHHPNFAGVNFAICASIIYGFNSTHKKSKRPKALNAVSTSLLIISALLVMASGSRTGMLGYTAALLGYFYTQKRIKVSTIMILAFLALIVFIGLDSIIELFAHYIPGINRATQAGNTRDEVWLSMWNDFMANPFFGAGSSVIGTASSYLRVLAIGGLITAAPLATCLTFCVIRILRNKGNFAFRNAWLPGLLCILITSVTEGYLADALSLGLIYFVLIVFVLSFRKPLSARA